MASAQTHRQFLTRLIPAERIHHWALAVALALIVGSVNLFSPIDWALWTAQTHLWRHPASGKIVFVAADNDLAVPDTPDARVKLAHALDALGRSGAAHIYLDLRLDQASTPDADARLAAAIARLGPRLSLVRANDPSRPVGLNQGFVPLLPIAPQFARNVQIVLAPHRIFMDGFVWSLGREQSPGDINLPILAIDMAKSNPPGEKFPVDYSMDFDSIPKLTLSKTENLFSGSKLSGKIALVGRADSQSSGYTKLPARYFSPEALIDIYGAETLLQGHGHTSDSRYTFLLIVITVLIGAVLPRKNLIRRVFYAMSSILIAAIFLLCSFTHTQSFISNSIGFLIIYAISRWLAGRRARLALIDPLTGFPSFQALTTDLADPARCAATAIIVARIINYDDVLAAVPAYLHVQYALAIGERLRVADPNLKLYKATTGIYAWTAPIQSAVVIEDHLKGLRAIFAQPLLVGGQPVDIAITFGVDSTEEASATTKLAAASASAQKANQSHQPVRHAAQQAAQLRQWEVSIHAAIDAAMGRREFYTVYQPQYDLATGEMVGAEALARWRDPQRGEISPAYFIEQAEQAGRMEALTRFVLNDALAASDAIRAAGGPPTISVNISATLLADDTVPRLLREVLQDRRGEARVFTLEITETSRIADLRQAEATMAALRTMGARISIDDFGIEAGNFLNVLHLPCDELKIDRAFVSRIKHVEKARHIVASIAHLGRRAGITTVAEGIEDETTLRLLAEVGCDSGQGYYLARPLRLETLLRVLTETGKKHLASRL